MKSPDSITRIALGTFPIRAAVVSLKTSLQTLLSQHAYPAQVAQFLSHTIAGTLLLNSGIKIDGRIIVQMQNAGPIALLVAKCHSNYDFTGVAKWDNTYDMAKLEHELIGGQMVVTMLQDHNIKPMQSILALPTTGVAGAFEHYFSQSAQLPTRILFHQHEDELTAILLQAMPDCDAAVLNGEADLIAQNLDANYADASLPNIESIFPGHIVRVLAEQSVRFHCGCTLAKMENAIRTMGESDALSLLQTNKSIEVTCDFCHHQYAFNEAEVREIFS